MHLVGSFVPLRGIASFMADVGVPGALTLLELLTPTDGVNNLHLCTSSQNRTRQVHQNWKSIFIVIRISSTFGRRRSAWWAAPLAARPPPRPATRRPR